MVVSALSTPISQHSKLVKSGRSPESKLSVVNKSRKKKLPSAAWRAQERCTFWSSGLYSNPPYVNPSGVTASAHKYGKVISSDCKKIMAKTARRSSGEGARKIRESTLSF